MILFASVSKSYSAELGTKAHTALADVSFSLRKGETLGLVGANGAGKPETANFPSNLTVLDMLRFTGNTCNLSKQDIKASSEKWLRRLGLWDARKKPLRNYSKGMQQRANFAIALLNDPELLILDEPMSGLDPIGRADILALIAELKIQGRSILFCSHILEDVDRLVDQVLVLHEGKKLFEGQPQTLAEQQGRPSFVEGYLRLIEQVQQ